MLLKSPLRGALLGIIIAQVDAQNTKCFSNSAVGMANYKSCCPDGQISGEGAIDGVVFKYTCGTFAMVKNDYGDEQEGQFSSAKDCAQAVAADPKWNTGV
jgi:hypothetical protein